jgi:hypothetical protein
VIRELHIRTVAAILIWIAVVLLILNNFFKSGWLFLIPIAIVLLAVLLYFIPRLRK